MAWRETIIHNSDYDSVEQARAAVDRYIGERNEYFEIQSALVRKSGARSALEARSQMTTTVKESALVNIDTEIRTTSPSAQPEFFQLSRAYNSDSVPVRST